MLCNGSPMCLLQHWRNPPQTHDHKMVNKRPHFPKKTATTAMLLEKTPCYPANTMDKTQRKPTENPRIKTPSFSRKHCGDLKKRPIIQPHDGKNALNLARRHLGLVQVHSDHKQRSSQALSRKGLEDW